MGISKPSQAWAKHQKIWLSCITIDQLATGTGHNQPRLSFDGYFKA
jgi:hypothetical protein